MPPLNAALLDPWSHTNDLDFPAMSKLSGAFIELVADLTTTPRRSATAVAYAGRKCGAGGALDLPHPLSKPSVGEAFPPPPLTPPILDDFWREGKGKRLKEGTSNVAPSVLRSKTAPECTPDPPTSLNEGEVTP